MAAGTFLRQIGHATASTILVTITTTATATVGQTIFVCVRSTREVTFSTFNTGSSVLTPITDSAGNTYVKDKATLLGALFRCHVTTKLPSGGTIHMKQEFATHPCAIVIGVWTGILASPVDVSRIGSSTTPVTSLNYAATTATVASDVWIIVGGWATSPGACAPTAGFTTRMMLATASCKVQVADIKPGTVGPHTYGWTWVTATTFRGVMVAYKITTGGTTETATLATGFQFEATETATLATGFQFEATETATLATGFTFAVLTTETATLATGFTYFTPVTTRQNHTDTTGWW